MAGKLKIALGQLESILCDIESNLELHIDYIKQAKKAGAELVVFPELSLTGYYLQEAVYDVALSVDSDIVNELVSATKGISVVAGFVEETEDHLFYNSALVAEQGKVVGVHRKLHLPDYGMFEEGRYFARGNTLKPFDMSFGRTGILVCEDAWHPRTAIDLTDANPMLLIYTSASPVKGIGRKSVENKSVNEEFGRFYSRSFGLPLIFVNKIGYENGVRFWGGSYALNPDGTLCAECSTEHEELAFTEIDISQIRRSRIGFPYHRDEDSRNLVDII